MYPPLLPSDSPRFTPPRDTNLRAEGGHRRRTPDAEQGVARRTAQAPHQRLGPGSPQPADGFAGRRRSQAHQVPAPRAAAGLDREAPVGYQRHRRQPPSANVGGAHPAAAGWWRRRSARRPDPSPDPFFNRRWRQTGVRRLPRAAAAGRGERAAGRPFRGGGGRARKRTIRQQAEETLFAAVPVERACFDNLCFLLGAKQEVVVQGRQEGHPVRKCQVRKRSPRR